MKNIGVDVMFWTLFDAGEVKLGMKRMAFK